MALITPSSLRSIEPQTPNITIVLNTHYQEDKKLREDAHVTI
jgi:hypothetical protein